MTRQMLKEIKVSSKQELIDHVQKHFNGVNKAPVVYHWKYKMDNFGKEDIGLAN